MKYLIYITVILAFASCSKQDLMTYEDGSGIYFNNSNIFLDTVEVAWGLKSNDVLSQKVKLEVKLIGQVTDYDRKFKIKIKKDEANPLEAKEGVDYMPLVQEYVMPKGAASTFIEVEVLRNPKLLVENRVLTIMLEESAELGFLYSRKLADSLGNRRSLDVQRVIKMTENFPMPRWWLVYGNDYFGTWSVKKQILICELVDIDRETWIGNLNNEFSEGVLRFSGVFVHRWLQEQDPKIMEADGVTPMQMGRLSRR